MTVHQADYQQLLALNDQCEREIKRIIQKHKKDPDLFHPIGGDRLCLYCEQYKEVSKKARTIRKNIQDFEKKHTVAHPLIETVATVSTQTTKTMFSVYNICFKDGSEFLFYSDSPESCCAYLKKEPSELTKCTQIPKDYYGSIYLENSHTAISKLSNVVKGLNKRTKIIAEKAQSTTRVRGFCYNETPFEFFIYSAEHIHALQTFCGNSCPITKTKKFAKNGRIAIQTPHGGYAIENGQVLLKIAEGILRPLSKEEFQKNFSEDDALVWIKRE